MQTPQANRFLLLAGLGAMIVVLFALSGYYLGSKKARVEQRFSSPTPITASVSPIASSSPSPVATVAASVAPTDSPDSSADGGAVACTMEAKQCPDGTYVGRTGPKCEFSLCPGEVKPPSIKISP